jgi:alcohol dehydrogenase
LLVALGPTTADGFAVGHEAVVEVLEVGSEVDSVVPGDVAACSFQLSCGRCAMCAGGRTAACERYPILSDYGMQPLSGVEYGGMLSDVVLVPHADAMLAGLPRGADPVTFASVTDNVADGYRAVAPHLKARPGAPVLVVCHGSRSIALYATLAALALGAGSVTFESDDDAALDVAAALGASPISADFTTRNGRWPIVIDCGSRPDALLHAIDSAAAEGVVHSVSYFPGPVDGIPLGKMYTRGVSLVTGRVQSAALLGPVLDLVGNGTLNVERVPSTTIAWEHAPKHYLDDAIKLVVVR